MGFVLSHPDDLTNPSLAPVTASNCANSEKQSYLDAEAELHSNGMPTTDQPDFSGSDFLFLPAAAGCTNSGMKTPRILISLKVTNCSRDGLGGTHTATNPTSGGDYLQHLRASHYSVRAQGDLLG
jgi:hypothetical protein